MDLELAQCFGGHKVFQVVHSIDQYLRFSSKIMHDILKLVDFDAIQSNVIICNVILYMASYNWNKTNGTLVINMTENVGIDFGTDNNFLAARIADGKFTTPGNDKAMGDGTET